MAGATGDEIAERIAGLLALRGIQFSEVEALVVSSVVPPLGIEYEKPAARYPRRPVPDRRAPERRSERRSGLTTLYEAGADRLVNAVAAYDRVGGACVVVDFGTGINLDAVSADGEVPRRRDRPAGRSRWTALAERGARIPRIDLAEPEAAIGKSTKEAIQSGVIFGFAGLIDGIARRLGFTAGGEPTLHRHGRPRTCDRPFCETIDEVDEQLTLTGLRPFGSETPEMTVPELTSPFRIGPVQIPNRVACAAGGIANWAFRRQSRRHGAGLAVSEMIASFGIRYANRKTLEEMPRSVRTSARRGPGLRLRSGGDGGGGARRRGGGADLIDINMGCPVPKICKTGAGAALLADPEAAARIVEAMVRAVRVPVTVKMRRGLNFDTSTPVGRRPSLRAARGLCLHPRAAAEEYGGSADHRITAEVVEAVGIPVIASGDIATPEDARRVLEDTGCAAIAVGRAALGNPWAYGEILAGVRRERPSLEEVVDEIALFAPMTRLAIGDSRRRLHAQVLPVVPRGPRRRRPRTLRAPHRAHHRRRALAAPLVRRRLRGRLITPVVEATLRAADGPIAPKRRRPTRWTAK